MESTPTSQTYEVSFEMKKNFTPSEITGKLTHTFTIKPS